MPIESRLFVKTALVALALAFAAGAAMAIAESAGVAVSPIWAVEHAHLAFVGWLVNIVIGIALWMLPLARERYPRTAGRYPPWAPMTVYLLLNGGSCCGFFPSRFSRRGSSRERRCSFRRWRNLPPLSCSRTSPGNACARRRDPRRACDEARVDAPTVIAHGRRKDQSWASRRSRS